MSNFLNRNHPIRRLEEVVYERPEEPGASYVGSESQPNTLGTILSSALGLPRAERRRLAAIIRRSS